MLDPQMLDYMRSVAAGFLSESATVRRRADVDDPFATEIWATVATYAARTLPEDRTDYTGVGGAQELSRTYYRVQLPHDADVVSGDRILIGGQRLEVMQIFSKTTDRVTLDVYCAVLDEGEEES